MRACPRGAIALLWGCHGLRSPSKVDRQLATPKPFPNSPRSPPVHHLLIRVARVDRPSSRGPVAPQEWRAPSHTRGSAPWVLSASEGLGGQMGSAV